MQVRCDVSKQSKQLRKICMTLQTKDVINLSIAQCDSILPMTYLIPFHLVAGSDPSKPGPTGLVAA